MIDSDSAVSFIISTIHITIDHEIKITAVIDIQQFNIMLQSGITEITVCTSAEIKNIHKFSGVRRISPESTFLCKCRHTAIFIGKHRNCFVPDSERDPIICDHRLLRIKYLICTALEIQKHDSVIGITKPVKICYIIVFCTAIFIGSFNLIFQ